MRGTTREFLHPQAVEGDRYAEESQKGWTDNEGILSINDSSFNESCQGHQNPTVTR